MLLYFRLETIPLFTSSTNRKLNGPIVVLVLIPTVNTMVQRQCKNQFKIQNNVC